MNILAISDIHGNEFEGLYRYLENNKIDLLIISGDITNFGPSYFAEDFLNNISKYVNLTVAIPGNCDPKEIIEKINDSKAICAHNNIVEYGNLIIYGFGGSNPTPFDTPLEFDEETIYDSIKSIINSKKNIELNNNFKDEIEILLTHAPPYDTETDKIEDGSHVGSKSVRRIIDEFQPRVNLCGHIHEARAIDMIGNTVVINPGILENGYGCLMEVDENKNIIADFVKLE